MEVMSDPHVGKNLKDMRRSYERDSLDESNVDPNPFKQFERWFEEAQSSGLTEPNAMVVATVDADGAPNTRTVLLKMYDEEGFVFFTNYGSDKAKEIEQNPNVSLQFLWLDLERQVKIRGHAEKISTAESMKYFFSRPKGSQLGAWVSEQSKVVSSRSVLMSQFEKLKIKFKEGDIEFPHFWGGYRIKPAQFEFWQGGKDRIHDRMSYRPDADNAQQWKVQRLAP
jgi:pyridoxamine 5'-phosphate oxidase